MVRDKTTPDGSALATGSGMLSATAAASGGGGGLRLRRGSLPLLDDRRHSSGGGAAAVLSAANLDAATAAASGGSPLAGTTTAAAVSAAAAAARRRSSNFSDYSQEARDLLNPTPLAAVAGEALRHHAPTSRWDSLPLAFALLPAVGGLLVQGGSSFVTDLLLLGLGAIFLHWSVTQPWTWYHAAQQIREEHEASAEYAVQMDSESESDEDGGGGGDDDGDDDVEEGHEDTDRPSTPLADVQEEDEGGGGEASEGEAGTKQTSTPTPPTPPTPTPKPQAKPKAKTRRTPDERVAAYNKKQRARRQQERRSFRARQAAALRELYRHEVLALLSCFASPVLGAYLLHELRGQLTRPSEGLISNYNLTIFLLGAEVRPLRHLLQLVQTRTLHLQRIVHSNPYREEEERYRERREQEEKEQNQTLSDLLDRLDRLEQAAAGAGAGAAAHAKSPASSYFLPLTSPPSPPSPSPSGAAGAVAPAPPPQPPPPPPPPPPLHRSPSDRKRERDQVVRDVRAALQPELDALARALRRTHKQQTLLEGQVAARFRATDQRLSDVAAEGGRGGASFYRLAPHRPGHVGGAHRSSSGDPAVWTVPVWAVAWAAAEAAAAAAVALLCYVPRRIARAAGAAATFPLRVLQRHLAGWGGAEGGDDRPDGSARHDKYSSKGSKDRGRASSSSSGRKAGKGSSSSSGGGGGGGHDSPGPTSSHDRGYALAAAAASGRARQHHGRGLV